MIQNLDKVTEVVHTVFSEEAMSNNSMNIQQIGNRIGILRNNE